jgi:4-carboxymuconolactone decarboxylase
VERDLANYWAGARSIGALNRLHELKLHVKAALKNGLTKAEIKEIFLQVAVYCGASAGIDSFHIAREAFEELENERGRAEPSF